MVMTMVFWDYKHGRARERKRKRKRKRKRRERELGSACPTTAKSYTTKPISPFSIFHCLFIHPFSSLQVSTPQQNKAKNHFLHLYFFWVLIVLI
uniref:Uncharacterized protein n=1 Tax=Cannabis sativa TaxID=3483 RepID=A0A803RBE0_CANSA